MRKKIANKTYWQRGSGDIVGFLCTLPCIIFMLVLLISIIQIGSIKEDLNIQHILHAGKLLLLQIPMGMEAAWMKQKKSQKKQP